MFEGNKEGTKRKCNECGKVKSDVEFRTWDGIDASEWDVICASCLEKKERGMECFWVLFGVVVVMILLMVVAFGVLIMFI